MPSVGEGGIRRRDGESKSSERAVTRALLELASARGEWDESIRHIVRVDAEVIPVERVSFWSLRNEPAAIHCDAGYITSSGTFEHGATLFESDYPVYFHAILEARVLSVEDVLTDRRVSGLHDYFVARRITSTLDVPVWVGGRLAGVLCHEHVGAKRPWTEGQEDFATGVAQIVASALAERARTSAEAVAQRAAFLDNVSRQLHRSLDAREIADRVVRLLVPVAADIAMVWALNRDGVIEGIASWAADPRVRELVLEIMHTAAETDIPRLMRQNQSLLLPDATPSALRASGISEVQCARVAKLGVRATMVVPVVLGDKQQGAIGLLGTGRHYRSDDLSLAEDVGERVGSALENARLYQAAHDAIRARDESLILAAHELRTPLTTLQLIADKATRRGNRDSDPWEMSERDAFAREVRRLSTFVERLLDAFRIRSHGITLQRNWCDLAIVIQDCVNMLGDRARRVRISVSAASPVVGHWDRARLAELVDSLLDNAVKFGHDKPIEVAVDRDASGAVLTVRDHGMGIPPDRMTSLFSLFERAVPRENFGGLGLGLYVANAIAQAHGGSIGVASRLGEGAAFTVRLPLDESRAAER
jgi:signal transduction histidine kinase